MLCIKWLHGFLIAVYGALCYSLPMFWTVFVGIIHDFSVTYSLLKINLYDQTVETGFWKVAYVNYKNLKFNLMIDKTEQMFYSYTINRTDVLRGRQND